MTPATDIALEKTPLECYVAPDKPSLVGVARPELADMLGGIGVPERDRKMRAQQIWHWLYVRGATGFEQMTSVSTALRNQLAEHFTLERPEVVAEQVSSDGTRKWLLRLPSRTRASGRTKSNASTSRKPTAARFASRRRSAAR